MPIVQNNNNNNNNNTYPQGAAYTNNSKYHHHQHHHQRASGTGMALPRSQQVQQNQLQGQQQQQTQPNLHFHHHNHNHNHHGRNMNASSSTSVRGAKELGMLVMLLTAEAALLASDACSSVTAAAKQQLLSPLSLVSPKSVSSSSATAGSNNKNTNTNSNSNSKHSSSSSISASKCLDHEGHPAFDTSSSSGSSSSNKGDDQDDQNSNNSGQATPSGEMMMFEQHQQIATPMSLSKASRPHHHPQQMIQAGGDNVDSSEDDEQQMIIVVDKATNKNKLQVRPCSSTSSLDDQQHQQQQQAAEVTFLMNNYILPQDSNNNNSNNNTLLNRVFEYLPWRDALIARETSKAWLLACSAVNCLFFKLPRTSCPAIFIYSHVTFTNRDEELIEPRFQHKSDAGRWKCDACGFVNSETRILCGSRTCQMPVATHRTAARLFAGQLRREGSVPYLRWLFEDVIGSDKHNIRIKNVENHRDASTQRGKGCCWVYLEDLDMATPAVELHHRIFSDVHPDGREGAWIVPENCRNELQEEIDYVSYAHDRPRVLPRGALVVERPVMTPQMAPDNATISAKVVASHSSIPTTTNSYALMKSKAEAAAAAAASTTTTTNTGSNPSADATSTTAPTSSFTPPSSAILKFTASPSTLNMNNSIAASLHRHPHFTVSSALLLEQQPLQPVVVPSATAVPNAFASNGLFQQHQQQQSSSPFSLLQIGAQKCYAKNGKRFHHNPYAFGVVENQNSGSSYFYNYNYNSSNSNAGVVSSYDYYVSSSY